MTILQEYWPLAVVLMVALLAIWGIDRLAWNRGFDAGRSTAHRALDDARRASRL